VVKVTFREQNGGACPAPGPGEFPLGAAITLADLDRDPHPWLARLRAAEPVSWLPALHGWLVTRHDLAVAVMRDSAAFTVDDPRFSTARVVGPSMLSLDGAAHGRHRAPFTKGFGRAEIRSRLAGFVVAEADRLVAGMRPAGAADARRSLAGPLAAAVVAEALGLGDTDPATVLDWYAAIVKSVSALAGEPGAPAGESGGPVGEADAPVGESGALAGEPGALAVAARREQVMMAGSEAFGSLSARLAAVIGTADGPPSLLAAAAGARGTAQVRTGTDRAAECAEAATGTAAAGTAAAGTAAAGTAATGTAAAGLSTAEVISNAAVIMFGGIETTEGMICNVILHLLRHPGQLALVREDPALVPNAVEESLRLEPAAAVVDRYATRDVALGGAWIRAGDLVTVSLAGAGRDPAVFPRPGTFDVRRRDARLNLAFAHGPHFCLGAHLARLEAQAAVRAMLTLPGLRLDPAHPAAPRGLVFRKPPSLRVLWTA
jgi:cytochrome P450